MTDTTVVIFGATGDLTQRLLMPALYRLHRLGLAPNLRIIGYAPQDLGIEKFLIHIHDALKQFAAEFSEPDWEAFHPQLDYMSGQLEANALSRLKEHLLPQSIFFLALPPNLFGTAAIALGEAGLSRVDGDGWRVLMVEKPFGSDLNSAVELRRQMHTHWDESQILRIDHFLGKETTQNLMVFRFANRFLEPIWNAAHIEQVQITYAETLGVEKRASYYDRAGAVRDMIQNHLMQLFSLTAMEPLSIWDAEIMRNHKVEVLRAVRPFDTDRINSYAVRGQYGAGEVGGKIFSDYLQEPDIPPYSNTETFAALRLEINNWRWQGVPFYLRTGKRLASNCSEIAVQFRRPPGALPGGVSAEDNWMIFRIKPRQLMALLANAKTPGPKMAAHLVPLHAPYLNEGEVETTAYEELLLGALAGDHTNFLRFDEVEWAWRLLDPIVQAWQQGSPDIYRAGTEGPDAQNRLLKPGHHWRPIRLIAGEDNGKPEPQSPVQKSVAASSA